MTRRSLKPGSADGRWLAASPDIYGANQTKREALGPSLDHRHTAFVLGRELVVDECERRGKRFVGSAGYIASRWLRCAGGGAGGGSSTAKNVIGIELEAQNGQVGIDAFS
jgi:hypothetical protein